jgi:pyruvate formate lyase activating enzyme
MSHCPLCGQKHIAVSTALGCCGTCIRNGDETALQWIHEIHARTRREWGLPGEIPHAEGGISCGVCANVCSLSDGQVGACGLRTNSSGKLVGADQEAAKATWYHDPLPTNCVADWVCPGGTGAGFPDYAYRPGPELGYTNLAVFFTACSFDCLFCQNWTYRHGMSALLYDRPEDLADAITDDTSCICYFGGDPGPQVPFALKASEESLKKAGDRILRICWETNGSMDPVYLDRMLDLSLETGGCIKFDLKAYNDEIHRALTGVSNSRTLENFRKAAHRIHERPEPPLLVASTLLVPGYIEAGEVELIASFIASLDPGIPYSLLAFHPQFKMSDLPRTPRKQADECKEAALKAGLKRIRIGNEHLLR